MGLAAHRRVANRALAPLAMRLRGVSPNALSGLAFAVAIGAGVAFYVGGAIFLLLAVLFVFLNAILDALDGMVAKLTGRASARGDFLDHVLDRYADVIMIGGIAFGPYGNLFFGFFAVLGVILASYMGTQAQAVGLGRDYGGLMGRADRLVILFFATWIQLLADPLGSGGESLVYTPLELSLLVLAVLGQVTAIQRGVVAWRRLGAK